MWPRWGGRDKGCSWLQSLSWGVSLVAGGDFLLRSAEIPRLSWGPGPGLSCSLDLGIRGHGCGFGAGLLLPKGFTTVKFCPLLLLLTLGETLLVRAAVELGPFQQPTSLEETLIKCLSASGETQDPSPPLEGAHPCCLWEPGCHCWTPIAPATASGFFATLCSPPGVCSPLLFQPVVLRFLPGCFP